MSTSNLDEKLSCHFQNPIVQAFKEIQKLANHNRMREMPIVVMLTRRDLLADELGKKPISVNFPDYHGEI